MMTQMKLECDGFLAYSHWQERVVHLFPDCPEGKLIAIPRREVIHKVDRKADWCCTACDKART
jgi:hypothetical protein